MDLSLSLKVKEGRGGEIREKKKVNKKGIKLDGEKENEIEKNHEDREKDEQIIDKEKAWEGKRQERKNDMRRERPLVYKRSRKQIQICSIGSSL
jgi:hypothetical protein